MHRTLKTGIAATIATAGLGATALAHDPIPTGPRADNATISLLAPRSVATTGGPAEIGSFSAPFVEPTINGKPTDAKCVETDTPNGGVNGSKGLVCKPAAGTLVNLPDGRVLFWDALEGTENNKFSIVAEGGSTFTNDSARILDMRKGKPVFSEPKPYDGGANPNGNPGEPLVPGASTTEKYNDGALFGSHESFLPDGRLLVQGGTDYSLDPGVDGIPFGAVELTGLQATRIFDPKTNTFSQTGDTIKRRWYPTVIQTGDGKTLDFSGVGKLLKPVYPDRPEESGTNVKQVESYDPKTGKWTDQGKAAQRDLPLYPRMHLLPDGHVLFNAAGQDFNPFGQSAGEVGWNMLASFDPKAKTWTDLGLAGLGTLRPGFRGSTSSTLLPLTPDKDGRYTKASVLTAGGVLGTSPGSYVAIADSQITTIDTSGGKEKVDIKPTGPLNQPRWFGQNVLLPTQDTMVFSGANADEVDAPGTELPVQQAELFDHTTQKWIPQATAHNPRTYHNTAVLLPSGEILVGGHATISTLYLNNTTLPGGFAPHDGRDPSFEIYKPGYLSRGPRPVIKQTLDTLGYGQTFDITLAGAASDVDSVALIRNTAITHIVDADQRMVVLPIVARKGDVVTVKSPDNPNVLPAGPYMLFVNGKTAAGPVPSVAKQLTVAAAPAPSPVTAGPCVSRRAFTVHVKHQYRGHLRSGRVLIDGKRVTSLKRQTVAVKVNLRGLPRKRVTVRLEMTLRSGRKVVDVRRYRTCTPGHRAR